MIRVKRIINDLMNSNCFVIYAEEFDDCIIVDPGSKLSKNEIEFCSANKIVPKYIILTHEHTDHTWGVNSLCDEYHEIKVICSHNCAKNLDKESRNYFLFYFNDKNYRYNINCIDMIIDEFPFVFKWHDFSIKFIKTPGHSEGSMCFEIDDYLFTGDTLMQYKPFINKRNGSIIEYENSISKLKDFIHNRDLIICPGHGNFFNYKEIQDVQ